VNKAFLDRSFRRSKVNRERDEDLQFRSAQPTSSVVMTYEFGLGVQTRCTEAAEVVRYLRRSLVAVVDRTNAFLHLP